MHVVLCVADRLTVSNIAKSMQIATRNVKLVLGIPEAETYAQCSKEGWPICAITWSFLIRVVGFHVGALQPRCPTQESSVAMDTTLCPYRCLCLICIALFGVSSISVGQASTGQSKVTASIVFPDDSRDSGLFGIE